MGRVNSNLPYFVYAIFEMGQIGVGKKIAGNRARFVIDRILSEGHVIYSSVDGMTRLFDGDFLAEMTKMNE